MNSPVGGVIPSLLVSSQAKQRLIIGCTIGNALEFFDFIVFSFLMLFLGPVFFPAASEYGKLLLTTATFGVGFLMRPIGGMLIGSYADRHGRRSALTLTLLMMGLGCGMLAVVPSYAQIGVAAPCIVVLARLIQGFAAGGEVGASTTLLVEQAAPAQRGFYASWQPGSQNLGVMLGALVVMGLVAGLPAQDMAEWGWRIPFFIGMLTAPVGLYVRRHLEESLTLAPSLESPQQLTREAAKQQPLRMVFRHYRVKLLLSVLLLLSIVVCTQIIAFYMPAFAARELGLPTSMTLLASVLVGGIGFVLAPLVGMLSDRVGRKPVILWSRLLMLLLILPCYQLLIRQPTVGNLLIVISLLSVLLVMQVVPGITMLPELFPKAVRTTGMSVAYGLGVSVFGGFSQFFVTWLIQWTASPYAPAWTMMVTVAISSLALLGIRDRTGESMDEHIARVECNQSVIAVVTSSVLRSISGAIMRYAQSDIRLSEETIQAFQRDGAVCIRQLFSPAELAALAEGIAANLQQPSPRAKVASQPDDPGWFFEDFCNWQENPAYRQLIFTPRLGQVAAQLMGSQQVRLYHDHLLVKEPNTRQKTPWHQDQPYYNVEGQQNCSMWLPIDPIPRSATLEFVAGSHRGPWLMPRSFMDKQAKWFPKGSLVDLPDIEADRENLSILGWALEPGDAVFFHMLTLHAAAGVGEQRRRVFSVRFLGDDMRHAPRPWVTSPDFPGLCDVLPAGAALDHPLFPLLFPAEGR